MFKVVCSCEPGRSPLSPLFSPVTLAPTLEPLSLRTGRPGMIWAQKFHRGPGFHRAVWLGWGWGVCWSAEGDPGWGRVASVAMQTAPKSAHWVRAHSCGVCPWDPSPRPFSLYAGGGRGCEPDLAGAVRPCPPRWGKLRAEEGHSLSTVLWQGPREALSPSPGWADLHFSRRRGLPVTPFSVRFLSCRR